MKDIAKFGLWLIGIVLLSVFTLYLVFNSWISVDTMFAICIFAGIVGFFGGSATSPDVAALADGSPNRADGNPFSLNGFFIGLLVCAALVGGGYWLIIFIGVIWLSL